MKLSFVPLTQNKKRNDMQAMNVKFYRGEIYYEEEQYGNSSFFILINIESLCSQGNHRQ